MIAQISAGCTSFTAVLVAVRRCAEFGSESWNGPGTSTCDGACATTCTMLDAGRAFRSAGGPMTQCIYVTTHLSNIEDGSPEAVVPALAMSFVDWGFLSWAILGTLGTIVLMYAHYHKGMPLKPRALLYPIFGEKIMKNSVFGTIVDSFS